MTLAVEEIFVLDFDFHTRIVGRTRGGLLAPNGDFVPIEILNSEKVPSRVVLFADRHQSSAPEIGGV